MNENNDKLHSEKFYYDPNWIAPECIYGNNLISKATNTDEKYVVVTMEIPWNLVKNEVKKQPIRVIFVKDMHLESLKKIEGSIPKDIEMVMGIGGGSSHDCAKYIALKNNIRLIQFPTIFGGDAVATPAIGIRDGGKVKYIGHVITDKIYIDFNIIRKAQKQLVIYGSADILSSYTALLDWRFAADHGKEKYDKKVAKYAKESLLNQLRNNANDIKNITDEGIKTIVDLFIEYARIASQIGSDRAQEGSEHFFAYNAEYVSGRKYIHGVLLALGIWVSASFFHNYKDDIEDFLSSLGLKYNLESVGLTEDEFKQILYTLNDFTSKGEYYYSIVNEVEVNKEMINRILNNMKN